jgi:hypothetical protein
VERTLGEVKVLARLVTGLASWLANSVRPLWIFLSIDGRQAKGGGNSGSVSANSRSPHGAAGRPGSALALIPLAELPLATVFWRPHPPLRG